MTLALATEAIAFTEEQRDAIERRDGPLFLHAGAGSGKTSVLVERFVGAVRDDGIAVERLLAITFTERAAAQLATRIRGRLLELGLRDEARAMEGAWVSTVHGLCARLLRAHPLRSGVDPEFRVLDEPEAERLARDAFDRALEAFLAVEAGTGRIDLVVAYGPERLERMVRAVHARLRSRGERAPRLPELAPPVVGPERETLLATVAQALDELGPMAGRTRIDAALDQLTRCREALERVAPATPGDAVEFARLAVRPGNVKALATPVVEAQREAHAAWLAVCQGHAAHADYVLLRGLLERYDVHYAQAKERDSALDFEDLELVARDLLRSDVSLREGLRERFVHVMVDEFQDTNPLQDELLRLLARDNLFAVGDLHQSIYLFRNADLAVFEGRRMAAEERGEVARLTTNFRSRPELLAALNVAYEEAFRQPFQALRAPDDAHRPSALDPAAPAVELLVVDRVKERWVAGLGDEPFGPAMRGVSVWRAAEARMVAHRVRELIDEGSASAGEVVVLLRALTDVGVFERALLERDVPTHVVGGRGFFGQQQVVDLRAHLAVLANPLDEAALLAVLASPLVGASLDALALLGLRARAVGLGLSTALAHALGPEARAGAVDGLADALGPDDRARLAAFLERLARERRLVTEVPLERLIEEIITAAGYDLHLLALPGGRRRMANVRKLMRLARDFEVEQGRDLRAFVDLLAERELVQAREGEAPLEAEGLAAVRLMTVHAAKGLEFPVVFLADLGREGRADDSPLQITADGRVGLQKARVHDAATASLDLKAILEESTRAADDEERRVAYVGMTRAERLLVVSGATDTERWPAAKPLGAPMDWIWPALAPDLRELALGEEHRRLGVDGAVVRVGCRVVRADTLEAVLPREAWAPEGLGVEAAVATARPTARPDLTVPPQPAALPLARLSYTALEQYRRCPYRFYLEHVVGLEPEPEAELPSRASTSPGHPRPFQLSLDDLDVATLRSATEPALDPVPRGRIVHELLERVDLARPSPPSLHEVAGRIRAHGGEASDHAVAEVARLVGNFLASPLRDRLALARGVRRELPFAFTLGSAGLPGRQVLVEGALDLRAEEREGTLVVDYKTDRLEGDDPEHRCEEQYATQRLVYALAELRAGAPRVELVHLFLERPDRPVTAVYTVADTPELERRLTELVEGVALGRFTPTDRPHRGLCGGCPGRTALCSWDEHQTGRCSAP